MLQGRKPIKLIYRMATTLDYKDPHKGKESRYLWQVGMLDAPKP
jgi:hypothetical protein